MTLATDLQSPPSFKNGQYQYQLEAVEYQTAFLTSYRAIALPIPHSHRLTLGEPVLLQTLPVRMATPQTSQDLPIATPPWLRQQFFAAVQQYSQHTPPHALKVLDTFEEEERPYVVLTRPQGITLAERLQATGPLPEQEALQIIRQVAELLVPLHTAGLLHGDIQPQNLVWNPHTQQAVPTHLSWAKFALLRDHVPDPHWFTPGYTALEQYLPGVTATPTTDIYALAATLYTLLTGQTPIAANQRDRHPLPNPRQFRSDLSPIVEQVILQGMEINPRLRPQDLAQWLALFPQRPRPASTRSAHSLVLPTLKAQSPAPSPTVQPTDPDPAQMCTAVSSLPAPQRLSLPKLRRRPHPNTPNNTPPASATIPAPPAPRRPAPRQPVPKYTDDSVVPVPVQSTVPKATVKSKPAKPRSQQAASSPSRPSGTPVSSNPPSAKPPLLTPPWRLPANRRLFQSLLVASAAAAFFGGGFGLTLRFAGDRSPINSRLLQPNQSFPPQPWPGEADAAQFDFSNLPAGGQSPRWDDPLTPAQPTWPLEEESAFPPPPVTQAPAMPDPQRGTVPEPSLAPSQTDSEPTADSSAPTTTPAVPPSPDLPASSPVSPDPSYPSSAPADPAPPPIEPAPAAVDPPLPPSAPSNTTSDLVPPPTLPMQESQIPHPDKLS